MGNLEWFSLIGVILALLMSLAGWAFQLGLQSARIDRAERDTAKLESRVVQHHENLDIHTSEEWRREIRGMLQSMEKKIDNLPCKGSMSQFSQCE